MFRRVLRLTIKIGIIAGIAVGIAVVVKKLTAPPSDSTGSLEPWPPLKTEAPAGDESGNGKAASEKSEAAEAASNS